MALAPKIVIRPDDILKIPSPRVLADFDETPTTLGHWSCDSVELDILRISDLSGNETVALVHTDDNHLVSEVYTGTIPTLPVRASTLPVYHVSDAGSSGYGVFVSSAINRGELIMSEKPLLIFPQLLPYRNTASPGRQYAELEDAVAHMSSQALGWFFNLANSGVSEPSVAKGIIDTNSLHLGSFPGGARQYGVVCKDISRINHRQNFSLAIPFSHPLNKPSHSCSPNAAYHFDPYTFTCNIRALFPIPAGSQVFISYIDPASPRAQRQEKLSSYGFICACTACGLTGVASTQSETRRALIARADKDADSRNATLERWARTSSMPVDYINRFDKMYVDLFEKEQLYYEPVWEAFVARLFKASCALADRDGARKWASLAADLNRAYIGSDRGWDALVVSPERTSWWGLRLSNCQ
ncbi:hypothetical protein C2E23DRAFT_860881 [Lenzites betulinus]|nr:hypothetical protein C2E23DRAFT_860881 [Lenzites betulinus]